MAASHFGVGLFRAHTRLVAVNVITRLNKIRKLKQMQLFVNILCMIPCVQYSHWNFTP